MIRRIDYLRTTDVVYTTGTHTAHDRILGGVQSINCQQKGQVKRETQ